MTGFNNFTSMDAPNYDGYFLGTVKANNDPEQRQRIKAEIPNLLEGSVDNLPWITPILNAPFGMTSSAGVVNVPVLSALVVVFFQNGNIYYGMTQGSVHSAQHTPNPALLLNYPNRRGWADPAGNLFWVDITGGSVETHYQHPSGTIIHINNAGHVNVTCATANITGDVNITGDLTVTGDVTASGGTFTHNGKNVGSTHIHSGISTGASNSGVPV